MPELCDDFEAWRREKMNGLILKVVVLESRRGGF